MFRRRRAEEPLLPLAEEPRAPRTLGRSATPLVLRAPGPVEVVLTAGGKRKIELIKIVRQATGAGLKEAKDAVEAPPSVLGRFTPQAAADLRAVIEAAGGTVSTAGAAGARTDARAATTATRQAVWDRDGGRCVECGAQADLQFAHVIPVAMGGADSAENLQVLCSPCHRRKGASIG